MIPARALYKNGNVESDLDFYDRAERGNETGKLEKFKLIPLRLSILCGNSADNCGGFLRGSSLSVCPVVLPFLWDEKEKSG